MNRTDFCIYYKQEEEIPDTLSQYGKILWTAEKAVCSESYDEIFNGSGDEFKFRELVLETVAKFCPYDYDYVSQLYIDQNPEFKKHIGL